MISKEGGKSSQHVCRRKRWAACHPRQSQTQCKKKLLTTRQLLRTARWRRVPVEAYLVLNGGLRATHLLTYLGEGAYVAEGIDSEEYETTAREFQRSYAWVGTGPVWHLDA